MLKMLFVGLGLAGLVFASDAAGIVSGKCAACHGLKMEKHAMGKSDIVNQMTSAKIKADLEGYKAGTLNQHGMGAIMHGAAHELSDADIAALANYIPTLK
ncbi:c-type cytochrome [Helicobacter sp. 11S02629-2]|uniref:c-type cytochrome n=1 Tax=Helicobacter sp. 11S02629-2 TaxID=1476195 RepID=UPI000BA726CF|nr:c-type cytochrome [Helicobacter sp. 11S02629-2]PAF44393.1 cytochrome C [Helicobacter sp. 11S02629-2]